MCVLCVGVLLFVCGVLRVVSVCVRCGGVCGVFVCGGVCMCLCEVCVVWCGGVSDWCGVCGVCAVFVFELGVFVV